MKKKFVDEGMFITSSKVIFRVRDGLNEETAKVICGKPQIEPEPEQVV